MKKIILILSFILFTLVGLVIYDYNSALGGAFQTGLIGVVMVSLLYKDSTKTK